MQFRFKMFSEKDIYVSPSIETVCIATVQAVLQASEGFRMNAESAGDEEYAGF